MTDPATNELPKRTWRDLRWDALVLVVVTFVFAKTVTFPFLGWDDGDMVTNNALLHLNTSSLHTIWTRGILGLYTPVAYTIWALLAAAAGGPSPALFHALNLFLHVAAAIALRRLMLARGASEESAAIAALAWACHPLVVEPVAWVAGMNNLLAAALGLAALAYLTKNTRKSAAMATFLFALALLSKPTAIVLPLVGLILGRSYWRTLSIWAAMALVITVVGSFIQPGTDAPAVPFRVRPFVALDALGWYAAKTVAPLNLAVDYGRRPDLFTFNPYVILGIGLVTLAFWRKAWPIAIFIVCLLPVLGLRPFDFQQYSTVADRYAYLALTGPALWLSLHLRRAWVGVVFVVIFMTLASLRLPAFRSTEALFTANLKVNPASAVSHQQLALVATSEGRDADAIAHYKKSLSLRDHPLTHYNLANLYLRTQCLPQAITQYDQAIPRLGPTQKPPALTNRGIAHQLQGNSQAAERDFTEAAAAHYAPALSNLALLKEQVGQLQDAKSLYQQALAIDPTLDSAKRGLSRLP